MSHALGGVGRANLEMSNLNQVGGHLTPGNMTSVGGGMQKFHSQLDDDRNNRTGAPVNYVMQPEVAEGDDDDVHSAGDKSQ